MVIKMKKTVIIGISVLILVIAATLVCISGQTTAITLMQKDVAEQTTSSQIPQSSDVAGRLSSKIILNTSVPERIEKILVYKTVQPNVTKELTLQYAKKFGVEGDLRGETTVQSKNLTYYVLVSKNSGTIEYKNQDRPTEKLDYPAVLPSNDEAIQIATTYLKERDLLPEGANLITPPDRDFFYILGEKEDTISHGVVRVWFGRTLNGLHVEGSELVVDIGGHEDVIGYRADWRSYEPDKEYPLISAKEAFETLRLQGVPVGMSEVDRVSIDRVYLAYQTEAGAFKESYLKPVWVFRGQVIQNGQSIRPVFQTIPALKEGPA